jgi:hypothetical protein
MRHTGPTGRERRQSPRSCPPVKRSSAGRVVRAKSLRTGRAGWIAPTGSCRPGRAGRVVPAGSFRLGRACWVVPAGSCLRLAQPPSGASGGSIAQLLAAASRAVLAEGGGEGEPVSEREGERERTSERAKKRGEQDRYRDGSGGVQSRLSALLLGKKRNKPLVQGGLGLETNKSENFAYTQLLATQPEVQPGIGRQSIPTKEDDQKGERKIKSWPQTWRRKAAPECQARDAVLAASSVPPEHLEFCFNIMIALLFLIVSNFVFTVQQLENDDLSRQRYYFEPRRTSTWHTPSFSALVPVMPASSSLDGSFLAEYFRLKIARVSICHVRCGVGGGNALVRQLS